MVNEKRLIDANELDDAVHNSLRLNPHDAPRDRAMHNHEHHHFLVMIAQTTTVDAVEVVRCKDCRFYEKDVEYYPDGTKDVCRLMKRQMLEDGFCSVGERRSNEET